MGGETERKLPSEEILVCASCSHPGSKGLQIHETERVGVSGLATVGIRPFHSLTQARAPGVVGEMAMFRQQSHANRIKDLSCLGRGADSDVPPDTYFSIHCGTTWSRS